jgi:hypothetical protein
MSPPKNSYKDEPDEEYIFPQDKALAKIEFSVTVRGSQYWMLGMRFYDENSQQFKEVKAGWSEHRKEVL